jgi:hypothetical protein
MEAIMEVITTIIEVSSIITIIITTTITILQAKTLPNPTTREGQEVPITNLRPIQAPTNLKILQAPTTMEATGMESGTLEAIPTEEVHQEVLIQEAEPGQILLLEVLEAVAAVEAQVELLAVTATEDLQVQAEVLIGVNFFP